MNGEERDRKISIDCTTYEGTDEALLNLILTISECFGIDKDTFDSLPARNVLVSLLDGKGKCDIAIEESPFVEGYFKLTIGNATLFSDEKNQMSITDNSTLFMHQKLLGHIRKETYNHSSFVFSDLGNTVIEDRRTVVGYVTHSYDYLWNLSALQTIFETTTSDHISSDIRSLDNITTLALIEQFIKTQNELAKNTQSHIFSEIDINGNIPLKERLITEVNVTNIELQQLRPKRNLVPNTIKTEILGVSSFNDITETEYRKIVNGTWGIKECEIFNNTYKDIMDKKLKTGARVLN